MDHRKRNAELYLTEGGEFIDVIQVADDLGAQRTSLMSPATCLEIIKPYQAELIAHIKKVTKARVYHHSCESLVSNSPGIWKIKSYSSVKYFIKYVLKYLIKYLTGLEKIFTVKSVK